MTGWRIAQALIMLLFASPFIYMYWWGFQMTAWTAQVQGENDAAILNGTEMGEVAEMPSSPFWWITRGIERQRTTSQAFLNDDRIVIVSEYLGIEDVLKPGEPAPDPAFDELYVTARAPSYMIARCAEVLETLGSQCGLIKTKIASKDDGEFRVTARLAYIPNYDIGPTELLGAEFVPTGLGGERMRGVELPVQSADNRVAALNRSLRGCDALRESYQSCVVGFVRFDHVRLTGSEIENAPAGTNPDRMRVSTQLEVFMLETRATRRELVSVTKQIDATLN